MSKSVNRIGLIIVAVYVLVVSITASRLTFFWDDLDALIAFDETGASALFQAQSLHWAPLGRWLLWVTALIFGTNFWGYAAINAILFGFGTLIYLRVARPNLSAANGIVAMALLVLILVSVGSFATVFVAITSSGLLGYFLGSVSAWLFLNRGRPLWAGVLFVLAALCATGSAPVVALLIVSVTAIRVSFTPKRPAVLPFMTFIASTSAIALVAGVMASRYLATSYYANLESASLGDLLERWQEVVRDFMVAGGSWVLIPQVPGAMSSTSLYVRIMIAATDYFPLTVAWLGLLLLALAYLMMGSRWSALWPSLVVIIAFIASVAIVVIARSPGILTPRYQSLWMPAFSLAVLAVLLVLSQPSHQRRKATLQRGLRATWGFVLSFGAVVGIAMLPWSIQDAANLDRPRWAESAKQIELSRTCQDPLNQDLRDLSGAFTAEEVCQAYQFAAETQLGNW